MVLRTETLATPSIAEIAIWLQDATNISLLDGSTDVAAATRGLGPPLAQQNGGPGAAAATGHGMGSTLVHLPLLEHKLRLC